MCCIDATVVLIVLILGHLTEGSGGPRVSNSKNNVRKPKKETKEVKDLARRMEVGGRKRRRKSDREYQRASRSDKNR